MDLDLPAEEQRVLGALVEKEATVPDTYPMTLKGLRSACNQSSNRDPVVDLDEVTVQRTLDRLKERRLVRFVHPAAGERTTKFRQVLDEALDLGSAELAVLALLLLRGPQTPGELRTRSERLHAFGALDEVAEVLDGLAGREDPLVVELARQPGDRQVRWSHLLGGDPVVAAGQGGARPGGAEAPVASVPADVDRLAQLEGQLSALTVRVAHLEAELGLGDEP